MKKPSLHQLSREMPSPAEFEQFISSLDDMDARAVCLILTSFLDSLLERFISTEFIELEPKKLDGLFRSASAPLSSFASKITLAHALGLFGDNFAKHLNTMRSIRNAFAHSLKKIEFEQPEVENECNKLDPASLCDYEYRADLNTARERFIVAATMVGTVLMGGIKRAKMANGMGLGRTTLPDKFVLRHPQGSQSQGDTVQEPPPPPQSFED